MRMGGGLGLSEGEGDFMGSYVHYLYIPLVLEGKMGEDHQRIMLT
jgi:hypothetical protein